MQDAEQQAPPPTYHLERIIDKRASTAGLKQGAFWCMDHVQGWCSHEKASILIDIVLSSRPTTVVEIGVWAGKSLLPMAYALKALGQGTIYGIDPWDPQISIQGMENDANIAHWSRVDHEATFRGLLEHVTGFGLSNQVELIRATSEEAPLIHDIDVLHIDGNHSKGVSFLDVLKWAPLVRKGGWIILDDITWYENGTYTQTAGVEWLDQHCHRMAVITDFEIWGIWVKL